jgi:hypothetical protein
MSTLIVGTNVRQFGVVSPLLSPVGAKVFPLHPSAKTEQFFRILRTIRDRTVAFFVGTHPEFERGLIRLSAETTRVSGGNTKIVAIVEERLAPKFELEHVGVHHILRFPSLDTNAHITLAAIELAKRYLVVSETLGVSHILPETLIERERGYFAILEALLGHYRRMLHDIEETCVAIQAQIRELGTDNSRSSHWDRVCQITSLVYSNRLEETTEESLRLLKIVQQHACEMRGAMRFVQSAFDELSESLRNQKPLPAPSETTHHSQKTQTSRAYPIKKIRGKSEVTLGTQTFLLPERIARVLKHLIEHESITEASYGALGITASFNTIISELRQALNTKEKGIGNILYRTKDSEVRIDYDALESIVGSQHRPVPRLPFTLVPCGDKSYHLMLCGHTIALNAQLATVARLLLSRNGFVSYQEFIESGISVPAPQILQLRTIFQHLLPAEMADRPIILCGVNRGYCLNHVLLRKVLCE